MNHTLKLINGVFYLLSDQIAAKDEFILVENRYCIKAKEPSEDFYKVIGCSDLTICHTNPELRYIGQEINDNYAYNEWRCNVSSESDKNIIVSNVRHVGHCSDSYLEWLKWCRDNGRELPPMTGNQSEFAEKLLSDKGLFKIMSNVGSLHTIFESIYYYIKHRD